MGRPLFADPELPNKAKEGRFDEIRTCIACNQCFAGIETAEGITCSINYRAGREGDYPIKPAPTPKKVIVVGGGPAGMEAARVAALRGHKVTLIEKADKLGGMLRLAAVPPGKGEINEFIRYLSVQMEKLGVKVQLKRKTTAKGILRGKPDAVIVATGGTPLIPDIPGVRRRNVVTALDVLSGRKEVGENVVIVGGGLVGCETAEFLAEKGKRVTIIEMLPRIGNDIIAPNRWVTMQRLRGAGVRMETRAKAEEITKTGVRVARDGKSEFFEADTIVLATGLKPDKSLAQELQGKVASLHVIGDCAEPGKIINAVEQGFLAGYKV